MLFLFGALRRSALAVLTIACTAAGAPRWPRVLDGDAAAIAVAGNVFYVGGRPGAIDLLTHWGSPLSRLPS